MRWYWLTLGGLAIWRLTHLLVAEDGPWDLFVRLRRAAGTGVLGELLDCFYCLSLWIAAPLAYLIGGSWPERALLWPALSALACALERLTSPPAPPPPALYREDEGATDELLRPETTAPTRR